MKRRKIGMVLVVSSFFVCWAAAQAPFIRANSYEALKMGIESKRAADETNRAKQKEFLYMGKTYRGEVLEIIPAVVRIKRDDGRIGTLPLDMLNLEFSASLDMTNSPYKKLVKAQNELFERRGLPQAQTRTKSLSEPENTDNGVEKRIGDIKVEIVSVGIKPCAFEDMFGDRNTTKESFLLINLRITNTSTTTKANYDTWRGKLISANKDFASVTDDFGNIYKRISMDTTTPINSVARNSSIYPGKSVNDTLVFEAPIESANTLTIDMPGDNIGQVQPIKFTLKTQDITQ